MATGDVRRLCGRRPQRACRMAPTARPPVGGRGRVTGCTWRCLQVRRDVDIRRGLPVPRGACWARCVGAESILPTSELTPQVGEASLPTVCSTLGEEMS